MTKTSAPTPAQLTTQRAHLAIAHANWSLDQPGARDALIGMLEDWLAQHPDALPDFMRPIRDAVIPEILATVIEAARDEPTAANVVERALRSGHTAKAVALVRQAGLPHPILAFCVEVQLIRDGITQDNDPHLRTALGNMAQLVVDALTRQALSIKNTRPGPRKDSVELPGFSWDADRPDRRLVFDVNSHAKLRLACTRENGAALVAYFTRVNGTERGAQALAMKALRIKDARTFHNMPSVPYAGPME